MSAEAIKQACDGMSRLEVLNPFDRSVVGTVPLMSSAEAPALFEAAAVGVVVARRMPRHQRAAILEHAARQIEASAETFAALIVAEAGKTIKQARKEVLRCCNTLKLSAEEARRSAGEVIPFDSYAGSENRKGWFSREPLGLIAAITPYNDPLNLVAHKLGPAIAGGNAVILKPSDLAPLSAFKLVETLQDAGLPREVVTVVAGGVDLSEAIVSARDVRMISFTGGFEVGRAIARTAGLKKLAMDLGGNAPVLVLKGVELISTVESCVSGAFWAAGQNCIGTQRIMVDRTLYAHFVDELVKQTEALRSGDPTDEATHVGPMITDHHAQCAIDRIEDAVRNGAKVLVGGNRNGAVVQPTVLVDMPHHSCLWREEAFSPVVSIEPFDDLDAAVALANASPYALHAAVFTNDLNLALELADRIDAGGVIINDSSDYRFDAMPFGGFKYGSLGREGVRFSYEEMTQPKVVCINRLGLP